MAGIITEDFASNQSVVFIVLCLFVSEGFQGSAMYDVPQGSPPFLGLGPFLYELQFLLKGFCKLLSELGLRHVADVDAWNALFQ